MQFPIPYCQFPIPSSHAGNVVKPEGERDEADDRGHAGPVDIGLFHIADELHQQHPGDDDEGENDDKPDHATLQSEAIAPLPYVGTGSADFSMGVRAVIHRRGNRKRSFVFTGARNMLPERRALVAQLVEQRFCNSLDQSAKALESRNVFQSRVLGVCVRVNVPP